MRRGTRLLLQIGSLLLVVTAVMHLIAHYTPPPPPASEAEAELWRLMNEHELDLTGMKRTTYRLMRGFSLTFAMLILISGLTYLGLLQARPDDRGVMRAVTISGTLLAAVMLGISVAYFILPPIVLFSLALVPFLAATVVQFGSGFAVRSSL